MFVLSGLLLVILAFCHPRRVPIAIVLVSTLLGTMYLLSKPDYAREGTVFVQSKEIQVCGAVYFDTYMVAYTPTNHQRLVFSGTFVEVEEGFMPKKGITYSVRSPAYTDQAFEIVNPTIGNHLYGISASGSKYAIYGDYTATQK